jgi:SAM-dependent methyltransferase
MSVIIEDVHPLDRHYGMGRGVPIARHYINRYVEAIAPQIRGKVLEFGAPTYSASLDCTRETISIDDADAPTLRLDICDPTVIRLRGGAYDFIICTSVLHLVPDPRRAVENMHELLKPGGTLLVAEKAVSIVDPWLSAIDKWRFTPVGLRALLAPFADVQVEAFGNLYTMCAYLSGRAAAEIPQEKLDYHDPSYPIVCIATATRARAR